MNFNDHSRDFHRGEHAFLGASTYSRWLNKDIDDILDRYINFMAATKKGTEDHDFARRCIERRQNLPRSRKTLNMYVNDAIGFRMKPEVELYFSPVAYGTADAIGYYEKKKLLRIHDLKTGITPASMNQLEVYAAFFFLEYKDISLRDTDIELRIYQSNEIFVENPGIDVIAPIMDKLTVASKKILDMEGRDEFI